MEIHGSHSFFINLSIKDFQAAENQGAVRSGHYPAPPQVEAQVNIYKPVDSAQLLYTQGH